MGESATAMGRWRAVGMPASRPTGRSGLGYRVGTALGTRLVPTRVEKPQAQLPVAHKGSLPDLRISAPSGFARILVWARDATDFRPSMNGSAVLSRAGAWSGEGSESDGATAQAFTGPRDFGPPRDLHAYWCGRATRPIFDHR